jgi:hypothetical protein
VETLFSEDSKKKKQKKNYSSSIFQNKASTASASIDSENSTNLSANSTNINSKQKKKGLNSVNYIISNTNTIIESGSSSTSADSETDSLK